MTQKTTSELRNELKKAKRAETFIENNAKELTDCTVCDILIQFLIDYNVPAGDIIKRSDISTSYAYQIFEGRKNASRDKLLRLALAFPLSEADTERLLTAGGYRALYVRNKRDALIMFALSRRLNIIETNELLEKNKEEWL